MPQCPGCGKSFSRGYRNHLLQTQKPACHAVLEQVLGEALLSDSDAEDASYSDVNFEGPDDSDDEDDDEDLMYDANDFGEAPIPEQFDSGMDVDEPESDEEAKKNMSRV